MFSPSVHGHYKKKFLSTKKNIKMGNSIQISVFLMALLFSSVYYKSVHPPTGEIICILKT